MHVPHAWGTPSRVLFRKGKLRWAPSTRSRRCSAERPVAEARESGNASGKFPGQLGGGDILTAGRVLARPQR